MPILAPLAITIIWIEGTYAMARRHRVGSGVLSAAIGASLLVPMAGSQALPATVSAKIVSSGCTKELRYAESIGDGKFRGLYQGYRPRAASGSVKYCTFKYQLHDEDPSARYYLGELQEDWVKTQDAGPFFGGRGGPWEAWLASDVPARSEVFDATPSFKRTVIKGCPSLDVGYSLLGISLSLPQSLCGSQTVTRSILTKWEAMWRNGTASEMSHLDLTFAEKVRNKKIPTMRFTAFRPAYRYSWTRVQEEDHGYYYPAWKPTQTRASLAWSATL